MVHSPCSVVPFSTGHVEGERGRIKFCATKGERGAELYAANSSYKRADGRAACDPVPCPITHKQREGGG